MVIFMQWTQELRLNSGGPKNVSESGEKWSKEELNTSVPTKL